MENGNRSYLEITESLTGCIESGLRNFKEIKFHDFHLQALHAVIFAFWENLVGYQSLRESSELVCWVEIARVIVMAPVEKGVLNPVSTLEHLFVN